MSEYSNKQRIFYKSQSQIFPAIGKMLDKNKKYKYRDINKQKALRFDIDNFIHHLVNKQNNPCEEKLAKNHFKFISNKIQQKQQHFIKKLQFLPPSNAETKEIKIIKMQLQKYIAKIGKFPQASMPQYAQFLRLCQQSIDYLQYYLKNYFKEDGKDFQILHTKKKQFILSLLKTHYKCLTQNPSEIANRIMLTLGINPLNDFGFLNFKTFSRFRKVAIGTQTKVEGRHFIVDYFMINNKNLNKRQFWAIIGGIIRKLQKVINHNNVQHLIERIQIYGNSFFPETITAKQLHQIIISQHFFIWEELLNLIFTI